MSKAQIENIARLARESSHALSTVPTHKKNAVLKDLAKTLVQSSRQIMKENARDVKAAQKSGLSAALVDRLVLNEKRIRTMSAAVLDVAKLPDPVGEVVEQRKRNGLLIKRVRIPLGVVGMIYESRPNVTVDAASLCFKSGNAVILRGGSEAFFSNKVLVKIISQVLRKNGIHPAVVSMVPGTDRAAMKDLLAMSQYIDVVIPRGGEGLMKFISGHSKIPVIKHDKGVCSIFVDESAKIAQAIQVIENAKVQRPGVCNALETLYVHKKLAKKFLPSLCEKLSRQGVEIRGDDSVRKIIPAAKKATDADYGMEYLDLILAIKTVRDLDDAIKNIIKYSSNHTESILTQNKKHAEKFVKSLGSSCVMVNTSTRFNDGGELGLGAEIGISTTKLHAYGPMGLRELTAVKYVVESNYKVRA